jgi:amidophosphoribosyltransferase
MAKDVGAKSVVFASCAPPIRHCNVYGIDMPSRTELVAHERDEDEIAKVIGADLVIYQTLEDLVESCRQFNPKIPQFDCSVFTGEYITGGINDAYLDNVEKLRNDKAKAKKGTTWQAEAEQENMGCSGPLSELMLGNLAACLDLRLMIPLVFVCSINRWC